MPNLKKNLLFTAVAAILISTGLSLPTYAHLPSQDEHQVVPSLSPMLQKVMPAVVNISVIGYSNKRIPNRSLGQDKNSSDKNSNNDDDDDDDDSAGPSGHKFISLGSGVIVDAFNGYVITNAHVLKNAKEISVKLNDGQQSDAKLIGMDSLSDIAILQIKPNHLSALPLAESKNVKVGDFVVAIGNPFGLSQTVTSGIVSGLQRTNLGIEGYENFIQTDAPINPGNSGGALANLQGQLIGINTAIFSPDGGGNVGIGFAVPSDVVRSVMTQIIKYGSVRRGLLGILLQPLTPTLAEAMNISSLKGALIAQVSPNSPADRAGLKAGDLIVKLNGEAITEAPQVTNIIGLLRVSSKIDMEVLRQGKTVNTSIVITSPQDYQKATISQNPLFYGANLRDFNQLTASHGEVQGVQVTGLSQDSPLWRASPVGLRPGDVIVTANMQPVKNTQNLMSLAKQNKQLVLNVYRGPSAMFVVIKGN